ERERERERESVKGAGGRRRRIDEDEGEGKRGRGRSIRRRARREGRMEPISGLIRAFAATSSSYVVSLRRHVYFLLSLEPQLRPKTRKSSKGDRWAPTEPSAEGGGMDKGSKRHRPPPLPVSEIKRRGRNLAEGCKYYKVTLRRMRELKGLPRERGEWAPEDNASE
ncbi:hypothetical protein ALC62_08824, partial [Cyphomyrmex costatus]